MYTISQLAKQVGLSRSTLLYYESIGLLVSSELGEHNYRHYSETDKAVLEKICMYRDMGIPLKKIKQLLNADNGAIQQELEEQLLKLNQQIKALRTQQQAVLNILQSEPLTKSSRLLDKEQWVEMFRNAGMSEENMTFWHKEFEKNAPEAHQDFLESIGLPDEKIKQIRHWAAEEE